MKRSQSLLLILFLAFLAFLAASPRTAAGQGAATLKAGIDEYNRENYEEAIEVLTEVRRAHPQSAEAAFYLGMAYRQTNDIENAYRQFSEAVSLKPLSDNAILQLIEVAILLNRLIVAEKWIAIAEENRVYPARVAFLKGTALTKEAKYDAAVAAFEKSKQLDPSYTQSADFQIGICYMNQRQYSRARDLFQAAVTRDPLSDMADYARRYQDAAEQWRYQTRPLRLTLSVTGKYDTNFRSLSDPYELAPPTFNEALENADRRGFVMQNMARLDFIPTLPEPFTLTAGYAALNILHQKYGTDNDLFANSFTLAPGMTFERFAVNLVGNYTHTLKREPGYRRYSEISSVGPLFRYLLTQSHILDVSATHIRKNFFRAVANPELEDQTSRVWEGATGWTWLFRENAIFSLRLSYSRETADGRHYDNEAWRASANVIYPLRESLRLLVGGEFQRQDYKNENVLFENTIRKDLAYTGTVGLTWSIHKAVDLIAQYQYVRVDSNIFAYDYQRDAVSLGVELKF
jgi:tetratricopeptide (TPR) repeat protein